MKKRKLKRWVKVVILFIAIILILIPILAMKRKKQVNNQTISKQDTESTKVINRRTYTNENYQLQQEIDTYLEEQRRIEEEQRKIEEEQARTYQTRMTSYHVNDNYETTTTTGSGLNIYDFETNENGWYTYNGKLVVATATNYLLKYGFDLASGVRTYQYYDELTIMIDGIEYQAIVLDSCGSSMKNGRIDLFVSNAESIKDTTVTVIER